MPPKAYSSSSPSCVGDIFLCVDSKLSDGIITSSAKWWYQTRTVSSEHQPRQIKSMPWVSNIPFKGHIGYPFSLFPLLKTEKDYNLSFYSPKPLQRWWLGCVDHEYRAVSFLWAILARIWCHSPWAGIQPYNRYMALQGMAKKSDVGQF